MSNLQLSEKRATLYNLISSSLDDKTLSKVYDNFINNIDLFEGIKNPQTSFFNKSEKLLELLKDSFEKAESYITHLSQDKIIETIKKILERMVSDHISGAWKYLNKEDILYDNSIYPSLFRNKDNFQSKYDALDNYLSNAWNNAICVRALVNWVKLLNLRPDSHADIFNAIKEGYIHLLKFIDGKAINKYPLNFTEFNTTCDVAFSLKMALTIHPFLRDYFPEVPFVDIMPKIHLLITKQNENGGWPFAYAEIGNNHIDIKESDLPSTCYALLFLTDIQNQEILDVKDRIRKGINYLLGHKSRSEGDFFWQDSYGNLNLEVTSLALQVLRKNDFLFEYQVGIKRFIERLMNQNILNFIENSSELQTIFNGNPVRLISLSLITLLKSDEKITSPIISIPFSWLLQQSYGEEKTNIIYIICCISEYLLSRASFLKTV